MLDTDRQQKRYSDWTFPLIIGCILIVAIGIFAWRDGRSQGKCEGRGMVAVRVEMRRGMRGVWCAPTVVRP